MSFLRLAGALSRITSYFIQTIQHIRIILRVNLFITISLIAGRQQKMLSVITDNTQFIFDKYMEGTAYTEFNSICLCFS